MLSISDTPKGYWYQESGLFSGELILFYFPECHRSLKK